MNLVYSVSHLFRRRVWRNSALLMLAVVGAPMLSFLAIDSKITGKVFRDFDSDGVIDTSPIEIGVAGVTVTAYSPTGTIVSTTTAADGTYSLSTVTGTKYRIEFTGLQTGDQESSYGTNNGTSVQFAASGDIDVDLGVNYPPEYSSTITPKVITSGFISGDQVGTDYATNMVWAVPFDATGAATKQNMGTAADYGSVYGSAYSKKTKKLYLAAFTKRFVGFGPSGPGAIYVSQLSSDLTTAAAPTLFKTLTNVGGTAATIHGILGDTQSSSSTDDAGFDNVGKTSLGDMELSDDEKDLYVINLFDKTLNKINIASGVVSTTAIPSPVAGTYAADYRPFALKIHRGKVYVGVTVTNESSYPTPTATYANNTTTTINSKGVNTTASPMRAVVYEYNGSTFTAVLNFPLSEKKQATSTDITDANNAARGQYWRPWTAIYRMDRTDQNSLTYPQPWLTGLDFDVNGDMVIGIRDRFGDQMGYGNRKPDGAVGPGGTDLFNCDTPGEVLRAGKSGTTWTIESKASVNGSTRTDDQKKQFGPGGAGASYTTHTLNSPEYYQDIVNGNVEGKFYWGDIVGAGGNHGTSGLGALAVMPGSGKLVTTAMDPNDVFNTGGFKRLINSTGVLNANNVSSSAGSADDETNNTTGANSGTAGMKKGTVLYNAGVIAWGKANGMGDIELLTAPAPIEIGNRVWLDADGDGIQDGDEVGIAGVTVKLLSGTTLIGTAVTDAQGRYVFSNATGTSTTALRYGITALTYEATYIVEIENAAGASRQTPLTNYKLTKNDADATTNGDARDSDGILTSTTAAVTVTTGGNGENNHSLDFGFEAVVNLGNRVWNDVNNNGILDTGEVGIVGVTVNLYADANNDGVSDGTILATTTTTTDGLYLFDNLIPGNYVVGVVNPTNYVSSTVNAGDPDTDIDDNDDNGITTLAGITYSAAVTLAIGGEPTGETPSNNPANAIADNSSNLTVDFGFSQLVNLGNRVWNDANDNGILDATEAGIVGVTVNLYVDANDDGTPDGPATATTTTVTDGLYLFNNLKPGTYVVGVVNPANYVSSSVNAGDPDTDVDDNDDNGITTLAGITYSASVTLALAGEPTGETPSNNPANAIADNSSNLTVDFGFAQLVNLGNKVWNDLNNNGVVDGAEVGIAGVTVKLYADANNDGTIDSATPITTTTTDANGLYLFNNLPPGNYIVSVVTPAGFVSSSINAGDPDTDADDNDDNGVTITGAETFSNNITLSIAGEPTGETPSNNPANAIADNSSNLTLDFGFVQMVNLGNKVWIDTNNNGILDGAEIGFGGVTVKLYLDANNDGTPDGAAIATTTTLTDGTYLFNNLLPGTYIVSVVTPTGYISSSVNAGDPDTDIDDNDDNGVIVNGTETYTNPITLVPGGEPTGENPNNNPANGIPDNASNLTVDFGFVGLVNLGNKVWLDTNNNGILDSGEPGLGAVTVKLYADANDDGVVDGAAIATTTTNSSGLYLFDNLIPGSYIVSVVTPTGYTSSSVNAGDPDTDIDDNDDNGVIVNGAETYSNTITLMDGGEPTGESPNNNPGIIPDNSSNLTVDFGFTGLVNLGNKVWLDANNNGILDAGEAPLGAVTVNLYLDANNDGTPDGALIATTTTNSSGLYLFDNLTPGNYIVGVVNPTGYVSSSINAGDPDVDPDDNDDNGVITTNGITYSNTVTLSDGAEPTGEVPNNNPGVIPDNSSNLTVDFGFVGLVNLGNKVWVDANNNGILDPGEAPLGAVTVKLYADVNNDGVVDGAAIATTTTNSSGLYLFDNLAPGNYIVSVVTPAGYVSSSINAGDPDTDLDDNDDNGVTIANGETYSNTITLEDGGEPTGESPNNNPGIIADNSSNLTLDFGFVGLLNIGNKVWNDVNHNGILDAGELGVSGVTVRLYADANNDNVPDGAPIATTTTDANGLYLFDGLLPGHYIVSIVNPAGYISSPINAGDPDTDLDDNDDNGITTTNGETFSHTITMGDNGEPTGENPNNNPPNAIPDNSSNLTIDFGIFQVVNVGNKVWNDVNQNGILDAGEAGIDGVTVHLYADANNDGTPDGAFVATTTTANGGLYLFNNLIPGTYIISVINPVGYASSTINAGDPDTDLDDNDDNGVITTTGETFSNSITLVVGDEPLNENPNNNPANGIADNSSNLTVDFGFVGLVNLGNKVWIDANNNGILDNGELPLVGATVKLYLDANNDGTVDGAAIATVTTDANGLYLFDNLAPGNYIVSVVTPAGYVSSSVNADDPDTDADDNDDNGVIIANGETYSNTITLSVGGEPTGESPNNNTSGTIADNSSNLTLDFGFVPLLNLGNKVWNDLNHNGILDSGEPGVAGVTVHLYSDTNNDGIPDGAALATVTTDANGLYVFNNLLPGNYIVSIVEPAGYISSPVNAGDPDTDLDDNDDNGITTTNGETFSNTITLGDTPEPTGESPDNNPANGIPDNRSNLTVDFGILQAVNVGNKVWNDINRDGLLNNGETGISGVIVKLYVDANNDGTADGVAIATTTTDGNGLYLFNNLVPGTYIISVVTPSSFTSSAVNAGDPDTDIDDNDDNGVITLGAETLSNPITLAVGEEPLGELPNNNPSPGISDNSSNLTVDFGFFNPALPVTLVSFNGKIQEGQVDLNWNTTAETNSAYFEVQRSADGKNWDALGNVMAKGESSDLSQYEFRDGKPFNGNNLYRLKMVDLDQTFAYSRIISFKLEVAYSLSVFPNPTTDKIKIDVSNGGSVQKVEVYSLIGRLVQEVTSPKQGEINVQNLAPGAYMLRITTSNGAVETRKVIVIH